MNEFHPKNRVPDDVRRCYLCDWEFIRMDPQELVEQLHDVGPYDEPLTHITYDDTPPLPVEPPPQNPNPLGRKRL